MSGPVGCPVASGAGLEFARSQGVEAARVTTNICPSGSFHLSAAHTAAERPGGCSVIAARHLGAVDYDAGGGIGLPIAGPVMSRRTLFPSLFRPFHLTANEGCGATPECGAEGGEV